MTSKIIIQLNNGELDIAKDIGFGLQYSIDEIKDPTKRNSAYSKTITLAGTKNNHYLLGNLFDINSDFTFFNPNIKTPARIIVDSTTVIDGFLQLRKINKLADVDIQGNQIQYEVVVFDSTVDFFSEIGDKLLSELDFSEYNHTYNYPNIVSSWTHTSSDVYGYPNLFKNSDTYETKDFKPAIFHKAYLEKIAEAAQFSLGGTLMDSTTTDGAVYDREIIPFNGDIPVIPQTEYTRRLFKAGLSASADTMYSTTLLGGLVNNNGAVFNQPTTGFTSFDDDSTSPNFDPNGHWNTISNTWTVDANGNYNLKGDFYIDVEFRTKNDIENIVVSGSGIVVTITNHQLPTGLQVIVTGTTSYDGTHTINVLDANRFRIAGLTYVANESGTVAWDAWQSTYQVSNFWSQQETSHTINDSFPYKLDLVLNKNNSAIGLHSSSYLQVPKTTHFYPQTPDPTFDASNNWEVTQSIHIGINRPNLSLLNGDAITLDYRIYNGSTSKYLKYLNTSIISISKSVPVFVDFKIKRVQTTNTSNYSSIYNEANNSSITDGDTITLNDYIPEKVKQSDIIIDLIKRYNLYITIDPDNDRKLILDTRDAYYNKGTTLDWTDKKDYSSEDEIELLSDLQNKEMLFTYKADKDEWNENYSLSVDGDIYGQHTIEFDNEFVKGERKVETPFSPTPLVYNSINKKMIVSGIKTQDPKTNTRVLYYAGSTQTLNNSTWTFKWITGNTVMNTSYSTYCYAGHYDDPIEPSIDLNFGALPYAWYAERVNETSNTLYGNHWRNYINQIAEGKLVTSKFNLNEVDIAFIKNNFNTKIFVKDSYYYINKIRDFDPTNSNLTTVELLKINDGVTFVPEKTTRPTKFTDYELGVGSDINVGGGGTSTTGTHTGFDNNNTTNSEKTFFSGEDNFIGSSSDRTMVVGDNNFIGDSVDNSGIIGGDNNRIDPFINNSWVIGSNNRTITQDNEVWVGDIHIVDGKIISNYNFIDGGADMVAELFPDNQQNYIDGGADALRNYNTENIENYIDGGENTI